MATREACRQLLTEFEGIVGVYRSLAKAVPVGSLPPGSSVLFALSRSTEPLRAGRLAELLDLDMSVVSRHLAHLVEHGWVERRPHPSDGRAVLLGITPQGRAVVERATDACLAVFAERLVDWSDDDAERLSELLGRLKAGFGHRPLPVPAVVSH
ncbi:MarR family winged helix-turn-helix transcriptional regulator [Embleya sp. AB8]|uniref:MarR family winged helix-turn-helix transcriptional regulator n=1 Tax=Embleya sp. AB8 TaxID=3156304 RepID=UPI003C77855B